MRRYAKEGLKQFGRFSDERVIPSGFHKLIAGLWRQMINRWDQRENVETRKTEQSLAGLKEIARAKTWRACLCTGHYLLWAQLRMSCSEHGVRLSVAQRERRSGVPYKGVRDKYCVSYFEIRARHIEWFRGTSGWRGKGVSKKIKSGKGEWDFEGGFIASDGLKTI